MRRPHSIGELKTRFHGSGADDQMGATVSEILNMAALAAVDAIASEKKEKKPSKKTKAA